MNQVGNLKAVSIDAKEHFLSKAEQTDNQHFGNILKNALNNISKTEQISNEKTNSFLSGATAQLHEVMISAQKAKITVETAVEIQQKAIDAYNEMMRMQI